MPDSYHLAKLIHLFSMTVMLGGTIINAVIHIQAKSSTPVQAAALLGIVVRINRLLMGPSLVVIPLSGIWLIRILGYDLWTEWFAAAAGLSFGLILAFVIGNKVERQLYNIASRCAAKAAPSLSPDYGIAFMIAGPIGVTALIMSFAALVLMIFKPF